VDPVQFLSFWFDGCGETYTSLGPVSGPFAFVKVSDVQDLYDQGVGTEGFYFRLCPMAEIPNKGRGNAGASRWMPGFWLDIDCGDKGTDKHYFPDKVTAIEWVRDTFGRWLTAIVDSGTGIHAYFKFDEPATADMDDHLWSKMFQHWAAELCPFDIDITSDKARVLRLPGALNNGKTVKVIFFEEIMTAFSDLTDMIPRTVEADPKKLVPHVKCPINTYADDSLKYKIMLSCNASPTFNKIWNRRYDFGLKDPSPSGYCMAIANKLVQFGYESDEAIAAVAWWRAEHGAEEKPPGWYVITMQKAMTQKGMKRAKSTVNEEETHPIEESVQVAEATGGDIGDHCLHTLSEMFGAAVARVVERRPPVTKGSDRKKTSYVFHFRDHDGVVAVSDTDLLKANTVCRLVMREIRRMPPLQELSAKKRASVWLKAINMILAAAEIEEGYATSSSTVRVQDLVESFLETFTANRKPADNPNSMKDNMVAWVDGRLGFKLKGLSDFMSDESVKIQNDDLLDAFRNLGIEYRRFTRARLWIIPEDWDVTYIGD
jgi:hypothetical protein